MRRTALLVFLLVMIAVAVPALAAEPLSLQDSIGQALQSSPNLENARLKLEVAESKWKEVQRGYLPQVNLSADYQRQEDPMFRVQDEKTVSIGIDHVLPTANLLGHADIGVEQAKINLDLARREYEQARQDLVYDVVQAFADYVKAERSVTLSEKSLEKIDLFEADTRTRFQLGSATQLDVMQSKTQLASAQANLERSLHSRTVAEISLEQTTGQPVDSLFEVPNDPVFTLLHPKLQSAIEEALQTRLEIQRAQEDLHLARLSEANSPRSNQPVISVSGGYNWADASVTGTVDNRTWDLHMATTGKLTDSGRSSTPPASSNGQGWEVGVQVRWDLYDGGVSREKERQGTLNLAQLEATVATQERRVELDVRQAFYALLEAEDRVKITQLAAAQAQENLRVTKLQSSAGTKSNRDVLDAELEALQAEADSHGSAWDYVLSTSRYFRSLGRPIDQLWVKEGSNSK